MPNKLNPLAPKYTPISPGIITSRNSPPQPFPEILNQIIPPTPPTQFSSHFYAYVPTYYVPQNITYYLPASNTPPRLLGRRNGPREVEDGRRWAGQGGQRNGVFRAGGRGRKEVFGGNGNERMWVPNRNERKCLGFQKDEEKSFSKQQHGVLPLKWEEEKTSVMIKNIPYDCPRKELMKVLDEFCMIQNRKDDEEVVAYDFLYLPIDFRSKRSRGFAFVNFTNAKAVRKFFVAWNSASWDSVHWPGWTKAIEIVTAKIQGKKAFVGHFSGSCFVCESDEYLPVTFNPARDGSGQEVEMTVVGNRRAFQQQRWGTRKG